MSFQHAARRSRRAYADGGLFFTQPVGAPDADVSYGDGMFSFTQPVGSPVGEEPSYGDGMFYFTQPVGAPDGIVGGTYGESTEPNGVPMEYGVSAAGKTLAAQGLVTRSYKSFSRPKKVSEADLTAFEKAAGDTGVWEFWVRFWSSPEGTAGGASGRSRAGAGYALSTESQTALADAKNKLAAATYALKDARARLVSGVPSDSALTKALSTYEFAAKMTGWYAQALRSLSGSTRKKSTLLLNALKRDVRDVKADDALRALTAQRYLLADAQSDFSKSDMEDAFLAESYKGAKPKSVKQSDWDTMKASALTNARERAALVFTSNFEAERSDTRNKQVDAKNLNTSNLPNLRSAFLSARDAAVAVAAATPQTPRRDASETTQAAPAATDPATEAPVATAEAGAVDAGTGTVLPTTTGLPEGAMTLEGSPEMKQVGLTPTGQVGEETFLSKYKVWIGIGAVVAVGGGYWWYTTKYLPSKQRA